MIVNFSIRGLILTFLLTAICFGFTKNLFANPPSSMNNNIEATRIHRDSFGVAREYEPTDAPTITHSDLSVEKKKVMIVVGFLFVVFVTMLFGNLSTPTPER